jgi:hypothetical protein
VIDAGAGSRPLAAMDIFPSAASSLADPLLDATRKLFVFSPIRKKLKFFQPLLRHGTKIWRIRKLSQRFFGTACRKLPDGELALSTLNGRSPKFCKSPLYSEKWPFPLYAIA